MKSALLVIDVQIGLFQSEPPPADAGAVIDRLNALADLARAAGAPVIFIQHEREGTPLARGSAFWPLDPRLVVKSGDHVVAKSSPDSLHQTALPGLLAKLGVGHLVVGGYASEFCVDTTVRSAAARGFPVTLVADGHTTHDKAHLSALAIRGHHNASLPAITSFDVRIEAQPAAAIRFA